MSLSADLSRFSSMGDLLLEEQDAGLELVGPAGPGDFGVAELALQRREQVHRIASPVGTRDLSFLLAEKDRELGDEVGVEPLAFPGKLLGTDEDQVGEVDVAQPGAEGQDVVDPILGVERVAAMAASPLV